MTTFQINLPDKFDFKKPEDWPKWIRRFERFREASDLQAESGKKQVSTLVYAMGDTADDIFVSFNLSEADKDKYDVVRDRFDRHFIVKRNVIYERAKFNNRKQEDGECIDSFITSLHTLSEHCVYGALHDEMIRDRIVVGLRDVSLSEKLQLDPDLTLEKAMNGARLKESVQKQQSDIQNRFTESNANSLDAVSTSARGMAAKKYKSPWHAPNSKQTYSQAENKQRCTRCGRFSHRYADCPAKNVACHKCNRVGHFASVCRSSRVNAVYTYGPEDSIAPNNDEDNFAFLGCVNSSSVEGVTGSPQPSSLWRVNVSVNDKIVEFKIDTGADVTVISDTIFDSLNTDTLENSDTIVSQNVYVVKNLNQSLLGRPAIESLGLIARVREISSKEHYKQEFPKLFQGLGKISETYTVCLKPNATPHAITTPRRIPLPLMSAVKDELSRMEELGVISKADQPTPWCAGLVIVPKSNGKVRICVDLTKLNESVAREVHPLPSVDETLAQLAGAKVFSKLDANSGFWQVPLSPSSSLLTTFLTPFGRYFFNRLPFGISSAPEFFQKQMAKILDGIPGVVCQMDDVLVYGSSQIEHDSRLRTALSRIQEAGLTLNDKCEFSKSEIKFLGHIIDEHGIRADPSKVQSIIDMPAPTNITGVRSFLGMVNQLGKFTANLSEKTKPLRDLLSKDASWLWDHQHQAAFESVKQDLCQTPVLALYDPNKDTRVSADASSYGLGAVISQKQASGQYKPVAFASRSLTDTESRYAQIEKEALAITWACERFSQYLMGKDFQVETDHKPLVPILNEKNLDTLPLRVQRFRIRLMRYKFKAYHVPGKNLTTPDTLSRAPLMNINPSESDRELEHETELFVNMIFEALPASESRIQQIREEQTNDPVWALVSKYCREGWPDKKAVPNNIKPYLQLSGELMVHNDLLLRGNRIVIPSVLQNEILSKLHEGHQGITKCRQRAKQSVWWPGLSSQLETVVKSCEICCKERINPPEPMIPSALPDRPWQKVATDIFELKSQSYLIVVDYFSRYVEIAKLTHLSAKCVIENLKSFFARHGIPEVVRSDNNPYNSEEFSKFAKAYNFTHITSSPRYPQSNGEAERAVQTVKNLLKKSADPYLALLAYRSTPLQNGYSPSELLMGRKLRTTVPILPSQLKTHLPNFSHLRKKEHAAKTLQVKNYNSRHRVQPLSRLNCGDKVWLQDPIQRGKSGVVVGSSQTPRSYVIGTDSVEMRRNRKHLTPVPVSNSHSTVVGRTPGLSPCSTDGGGIRENWRHHTPVAGSPSRPTTQPDTTPHTPISVSGQVITRSGRCSKPPKKLDI